TRNTGPLEAGSVLAVRYGTGGTAEVFAGSMVGDDWPGLESLAVAGHITGGYGLATSGTHILRRIDPSSSHVGAAGRLTIAVSTSSSSGAPSVTLARSRVTTD